MKKLNRRKFVQSTALAGAGLALPWRFGLRNAQAQAVVQIPLPGSAIPQFVDPLPSLHVIVDQGNQIALEMAEFQSNVLPTGFVPPGIPVGGTFGGTWVWGYLEAGQTAIPSYIGPVILAQRHAPTEIKFINRLGTTVNSQVLAWKSSTDRTLHWADPLGEGMQATNYVGPIPAVPHLHGGEVPPALDGGPDAWFLPEDPGFPGATPVGHAYHSRDGTGAKNYAIYRYPNCQEAANIWFHDHVLGITRLNVYAGMAGAYLLSDLGSDLPPGLTPHGLGDPATDVLLGDTPIIPLVIQDRMFDINGQLLFPSVGINPEHPFWIPEFEGDTIVVNGKVWPTIGTALTPLPSKRYRFLFLNGSNARTYELFLVDPVTGVMGPPMWVIGTDGGYLDVPAKIDPNGVGNTKLVLMPGERYDVIIDFNDPAWRAANPNFSGTLLMRNTGHTPYPKGPPPQGSTLGRIVMFHVGAPVADNGYDPATGDPLRQPMVRLADPVAGTPLVTPQKTRLLTLNEVMGPGGPLEVLVNNTRWDGRSIAFDRFPPDGTRPDFIPFESVYGETYYYSELPKEGETELWEIVNLTADAHPIHLHLVQFQLMNRQAFNFNRYNKVYDALFPGSNVVDPMTGLPFPAGAFIGGYGPPLDYNIGNPAKLGGNPDVTRYLQGPVMPPLPQEAGWKDTVVMYPGQVTRLMVRWAPTDVPANNSRGHFPFDPNGGHGYVWHCHIIDHEDNEMMRPNSVECLSDPDIIRDYIKGIDY